MNCSHHASACSANRATAITRAVGQCVWANGQATHGHKSKPFVVDQAHQRKSKFVLGEAAWCKLVPDTVHHSFRNLNISL